jgi:membrane protein involved in D-alanine export
MRFLLTAGKGKWFKGKHTASYLGLFLTFGLMGIWHGSERHYLLYGLYHAVLLCGYDWFARWNKQRKLWPDGPAWRVLNMFLTINAICFGLLIFSGRLTPPPPPPHEEVVETLTSDEIVGYVWERGKPNEPVGVDIVIDGSYIARLPAEELRPDLRARGYGDGRHGFRYTMPPWIHDGGSHIIEVKRADNGLTLLGSPRVVMCERR